MLVANIPVISLPVPAHKTAGGGGQAPTTAEHDDGSMPKNASVEDFW